jgi:hypothetical protein
VELTKTFWIVLTVGGTVLGTGLYALFVDGFLWSGISLTVIGAIALGALYERKQAGEELTMPTRILKNFQFAWLLGALVFTWVLLCYDIYSRYTFEHGEDETDYFLEWGGDGPNQCSAVLDGSKLKPSHDGRRVILICGLPDPSVDRFTDTNITVSDPFTIAPVAIPISVGFSRAMYSKIKQGAEQTPRPPESTVTTFQLWFQAAVIPSTCDSTDVHRLADVWRCGGSVIPHLVRTNGTAEVP